MQDSLRYTQRLLQLWIEANTVKAERIVDLEKELNALRLKVARLSRRAARR